MNIHSLLLIVSFTIVAFAADSTSNPSTYVFPAYKHSYGIRRAGPTQLFMFLGLKVSFDDPQGLACVRLDAWEDPEDTHDDDELTVYGVNSGENNIIYNQSMWRLGVYGVDERGHRRLSEPHGICANSKGDVYVADSGNHRIVRLFNTGNQLEYHSSFGKRGSEPGSLEFPLQVAQDNSKRIYVSDTGNNRIQVYNEDGEFLFVFNRNGSLIQPNAIVVADESEAFRHHRNNFVIVIDSLNNRINKFNLSGALIKTLRAREYGYSSIKLEYACLDYYDQILLTDSKNHCIHKFDSELNYITSFGSFGDEDYQFDEPRGIAIYRRFGQLFIAEKEGAQYYWVGTDILNLEVVQQDSLIAITFLLTEPSYLSVQIHDTDGNLIQDIVKKRMFLRTGVHQLKWDGKKRLYTNIYQKPIKVRKSQIESMPPGDYILKIVVEATYSSRTYFSKEVQKPFTYYP
jgi:hypothetical protein